MLQRFTGIDYSSPVDYGLYGDPDFDFNYVSPVQPASVYPAHFSNYDLPETDTYEPSTSNGVPSALAPHDSPYVTTSQLEYVPKTSPRNNATARPNNPSG